MSQQGLFTEVHLARDTRFVWALAPHADSEDPHHLNITFWYKPRSLVPPIYQTLPSGTLVPIKDEAGDNVNPALRDVVNTSSDHIPGPCPLYEFKPLDSFQPPSPGHGKTNCLAFYNPIEDAPILYEPLEFRHVHSTYVKGTTIEVPAGKLNFEQAVSHMASGVGNNWDYITAVKSHDARTAEARAVATAIKYDLQVLSSEGIVVPFDISKKDLHFE